MKYYNLQKTNLYKNHKFSKKRKNNKNNNNNVKTYKIQKEKHGKIHGEIISKKEGWVIVHVYGEPYQRGFAHGFLLYKEMKDVIKMFAFLLKKDYQIDLNSYLNICNKIIKPHIMNKYPEFYEEMRGIVDGFKSRGLSITIEYIIGWNSYLSMDSYLEKMNKKLSISHTDTSSSPHFLQKNELIKNLKCSAFIATGNATEKGDIIMAHNTHSDFITGSTINIILYITPEKGYPFVIQTSPGLIASSSDWFICSTGLMGCETTISNISYNPEFGSPYYCRIRQAMQYGNSIDEYIDIMLKDNAGDYACSWQFGDMKTNEIALFELGLKEHSIKRTFNGVYYGMNSAIDPVLRMKETNDNEFFDLKKSSGARNSRLNQLLNNTYYGKLNIMNSKKILSDHYDTYLHRNIMNCRSVCKHLELEPEVTNRTPFFPFGCTDGKVVNSEMAKKMSFYGIFGSSCGRIFNAKEHIKKHPEYNYFKDILKNFSKHNWIVLDNKI